MRLQYKVSASRPESNGTYTGRVHTSTYSKAEALQRAESWEERGMVGVQVYVRWIEDWQPLRRLADGDPTELCLAAVRSPILPTESDLEEHWPWLPAAQRPEVIGVLRVLRTQWHGANEDQRGLIEESARRLAELWLTKPWE